MDSTIRNYVKIFEKPHLNHATMLLGLSGWMDGADVSIGTVEWLAQELHAPKIAEISSEGFYIFNFPGNMEISTLFRPYVNIQAGTIKSYHEPKNMIYCAPDHNLLFLLGKEPNLNWQLYTDTIIELALQFHIEHIYFIGSVAGLVPHSREPRVSGSVNNARLKSLLEQHNVKLTDYEGPASIINLISLKAAEHQINMASLVAEIPAYIQGKNPRCIASMIRKITNILGIEVNLDELRSLSDELERKLDKVISGRPELANHIKLLEENYDKEVFETEMTDLKDWLIQQGIRVD